MEPISIVTGIAKVIVDVFNSLRGVNKDNNDNSKKIFSPSSIEKFQQNTKRLQIITRSLINSIEEEDVNEVVKNYDSLIKHVDTFIKSFEKMRYNALDIYIEGFLKRIDLSMYYEEITFHQEPLQNVINEKLSKRSEDVKEKILEISKDLRMLIDRGVQSDHIIDQSKENFIDVLLKLEQVLNEIQNQLTNFIRTNWTPKDLS